MIKVLFTKEQKLKYYRYELSILESIIKDDEKYSEFDDSYIGMKTRYVKNRIFELETA